MPLVAARALNMTVPVIGNIKPCPVASSPKNMTTLQPFCCGAENAAAVSQSNDLACQRIQRLNQFLSRGQLSPFLASPTLC